MFSEASSGLAPSGAAQPLVQRHALAAAGGDVEDGVGRLLDARQELHEPLGALRRPAGLRVARVQVDDRGAGLGRLDGLGRDLLRA